MNWISQFNVRFKKSNQKGQGLTEYAVVLSLVAVAAIAATALFGSTIKAKITAIGAAIAGEEAQMKLAQNAANGAIKAGIEKAKAATSMNITSDEIKIDTVSPEESKGVSK